MRTFILRARKGSTQPDKIRQQVGGKHHFEVILHSVMNAFFVASSFREDVEVFIVLDSSLDFPKTIYLQSARGLSIAGFHEQAILSLIEHALLKSQKISQGAMINIAPGVDVLGYGFEKLVAMLMTERTLYILEPKGEDIRNVEFPLDPVFILSDHLAMPRKTLLGLKRRGLKSLSLGKKMLFASQCIVLLHHEMDLQ